MAVVARPLTGIKYTYSDINTTFGETKGILVFDIEAINNQIYNIFSTDIGEVDYEPELGASMVNRLFDPNSTVTHDALQFDLYLALDRWLGDRISVSPKDITIKADYTDQIVYMALRYVYKRLQLSVKTEMTFSRNTVG